MKIFTIKLFICLLAIFNLNSSDKFYQIVEDTSDLKTLNPSLKDRKILKIRLFNGLKAYLISDKKATQSACGISVFCGSWDDPKEFPGMAHFCEHMLFKGSKKYPKESDYFKFIWDNSGITNAFTAFDKTVYMFSINHSAFEEALDRLSHFFKDPLFDKSHIAKELYAIDQEHSKNIENDLRRVHMISKEIGNPNHPNANFATGNSNTLKSIPALELKKWYEKNYSSNQMALTIYSNLDLDQLTKMVVEKFSKISNFGKDPLIVEENLFLEENKGKMVYIKPISNMQILELDWELKNPLVLDPTKSSELIAYTIKRAHKDSLLENLKKHHLAEDLDVNVEKTGSHSSIFSITIKLTDIGVKKISQVIGKCFETIYNLKKSNIPYYLFHEMQTMAKLNYQYQMQEDAFEFVTMHSYNILDEDFSSYPKKTILANGHNQERILEVLNTLNFSNCQFFLITDPKKLNILLDKKEKWTNAEYTIKNFKTNFEKKLKKEKTNPNIKIPDPNLFIPSNLEIVNTDKTDEEKPRKIISNDFGTIFYINNNKYEGPHISWNFQIKDKILDGSLKSTVLKDIYLKALNEKLAMTIFSAEAAGLSLKIEGYPHHIKMDIFGYFEKASLLLEEFLKTINNLDISKESFDIYYSSLYKDYENEQKTLPVFQAKNYLEHILLPTNFTSSQRLEELKNTTYKDFLNFKKELFINTYIEGFLSGNLSLKDAESIWFDIKDILNKKPFPLKDHYKNQIFSISENEGPFYIYQQIPLLGNGVVLVIDQNDFSYSAKASQNILSQALKEAFFASLRSEQKTSYIAHSTDIEIEKKLLQLFAVQSNSHDVHDLLFRFEIFIETYLNDLGKNIPQDRFENIKNNIIETLKNPHKNLQEMSQVLNYLAFEYDEEFSWHEKRIEALKALTYDDFISFSKKMLSKDNKKRLAILFEGKIDKEFKYKQLDQENIQNIGYYKNKNSFN